MKLLLDTHILLWWLAGKNDLKIEETEAIGNIKNTIFVSAGTIWEISIKRSLGKLSIPDNLISVIQKNGFDELPINSLHAQKAGILTQHHKDPFDRMLIAQAQIEYLTIVTHDKLFKKYSVDLLGG